MIAPLPGDIFTTGEVINNTYEVLGVLGRGGTGEVYKARNRGTNRVVAIKALSAQFAKNQDAKALIVREEEMRNILHDAVVRYMDVGVTQDGAIYLVMDFVDGPSLSDCMTEGGMPARALLIIGHRLADGLVATHRRGVVHRDLSPDNIILRGGYPEQAVIIDFGIAKDTNVGATTIVGNDFAGKYEYAAPEQLHGEAGPASDLYALGATLLAAFNGQVPQIGGSPGAIIAEKAQPLNTSHVPEPLKSAIDWLTAPAIADRAPDAEAARDYMQSLLSPPKEKEVRQRGRGLWLAVPLVLLALGGVGLWQFPQVIDIIRNQIPGQQRIVASPFTLSAVFEGQGRGSLSGYAPSRAMADALRQAFEATTGIAPPAGALTPADGVPDDNWANQVAQLLRMLALEEWTLDISNRDVTITGIAPDLLSLQELEERLSAFAADTGFAISAGVVAGPKLLPAERVLEVLASLANCGPLEYVQADEPPLPLGATVQVKGSVADPETEARIRQALENRIGDRRLVFEPEVLNRPICAVRTAMPDRPAGAMSIWLGYGDGEVNLAGVYKTNDNPIAEIFLPDTVVDGSLWAFIVSNEEQVYNLLPNQFRVIHDVRDLGEVENGVRRIKILFSTTSQEAANGTGLAFNFDENPGKLEIYAVLSDKPLFTPRRPIEESVAGFTAALDAMRRAGDVDVVAVASRLIDHRP